MVDAPFGQAVCVDWPTAETYEPISAASQED